MPLQPGDKLGSYRILVPIGRCGMGDVYRVRNQRLGVEAGIGTTTAERFGERSQREAITVAKPTAQADAFEAAHGRVGVYPDLNPSNLKINHDHAGGVPDFGLAQMGGASVGKVEESWPAA